MNTCFFVSDLHGSHSRYQKLFSAIEKEKPKAVFWGGDLLPSGLFALTSKSKTTGDFINDVLFSGFSSLKKTLKNNYPRVFLILGNDDGKGDEDDIKKGEQLGYWEYIHNKKVTFSDFDVYGYSYVPPTPFIIKDWERYDVSRYTDPGCLPPEEGAYFKKVDRKKIIHQTIQKDLKLLAGDNKLERSIFLFHSPPYKTKLDRAALDGRKIDHVPLDVHVGSIAISRFIAERHPMITLHGHIHESARITGHWYEQIGNTTAISAAHDGNELALVRFNPDDPKSSERELI
ncbi:MAG: metallophosphoesterase [Bacteroidetes bacterium]|nr:metallophosphoesterase [Bacteroidota bacterium]MBL6944572.1 metallophosphoesterase [Bacteroidales bacterium]